jgi:hypothetical protein
MILEKRMHCYETLVTVVFKKVTVWLYTHISVVSDVSGKAVPNASQWFGITTFQGEF